MSGVGGYGDENYQTFYKFTLDDYVFIASPPGVKHMNFTFRVTGLQPRNKLTLAFFGTTNTVYGTWDKDGIYTVDADIVEAGKPTYFYNGYGATRGEFTIEILPLYPGALVFDGVDDYGTCDNFPILTKERGYTVVVLRQWDQDFLNTTLTGGLLSTRNYSTGEGVAFEKIESSNYVLIVSNQGGIEAGFVDHQRFQSKIEYVSQCVKEYCGVKCYSEYCTTNDKNDLYRKPNVGMLNHLCENYVGDDFDYIKSVTLMIGDASGLEGQFSDSDKRTAENFGIDYLDVNEFVNLYNKKK